MGGIDARTGYGEGPKVTHLNKLTSSDLKGILFLVEGIVSIPGEVRHPCYEELQQLGGRA